MRNGAPPSVGPRVPTPGQSEGDSPVLAEIAEFLRTLLAPYDVLTVLQDLAARVQELLDLHGAGVSLSRDGTLEFITAVPASLAELEKEQRDGPGGPCREAFGTGEVVAIDDIAAVTDRWPRYCSLATGSGITSVAGIPMKVEERTIGALNLYSAERREWSRQDLTIATLFADAASVYLINSTDHAHQRRLNDQLQEAFRSRVVIEQAKGIIAQTHDIDVEEAFQRIRRHARAQHTSLHAVSEAIVNLRMRL
ncbi:GAF and ANTAR domain-containing protein [Pseudactinotalea sp. Z1748]|uniref:GAF and ANTAR domain-containing protein n=1 Tax=Pseudactinotalea sp. Z1748 TaxID=3413027 RepID=UPI003C7CD49B